MKVALHLKTDVAFYRLAKADKSLGGQWKTGKVKTIGPEYAYNLQDATGFQARWIMLGEGPDRLSKDLQTCIKAFPLLDDAVREIWVDTAKKAIEKSNANRKHAA